MSETFYSFSPADLAEAPIRVLDFSDTRDIKSIIKARCEKIRIGDCIIVEPLISRETYGIFVYDNSHRFHPLATGDSGVAMPSSVQCIADFPLDYWDDFMFATKSIPFNVRLHLPKVELGDVKTIKLNAQTSYLMISVSASETSERYFVFWATPVTSRFNLEECRKFFNTFRERRYFSRYCPERHKDIHLPIGFDEEHVLVLAPLTSGR